VVVDGEVIGGISASFATPEEDAWIAKAGLAALTNSFLLMARARQCVLGRHLGGDRLSPHLESHGGAARRGRHRPPPAGRRYVTGL
jgi:hypothetical protein